MLKSAAQPRFVEIEAESQPELTVVMPCLNEAQTLGRCIEKAQRWMDANGVHGEIVIGDNGSNDGSQEIARSLGARVVHVPVRGYGAALWYATREARGRYVIMGDSDDSYDFSNLLGFVERLRDGFDLVMGNRFAGGIQPGAMPWKNRHIGNPIISLVGRTLSRAPVGDFFCGLRGFSKDAWQRMDLHTTGMEYALEMIVKAQLLGLRVTEVPTTLSPDGRGRAPHLRPWRDGWRGIKFMLMYTPRWLFLIPGIVTGLAGALLMLLVVPGPFAFGGPVLDVTTLLYAGLMVIAGHQLVCFHFIARRIAVRVGIHPRPANDAPPRVEPLLISGLLIALLGFGLGVWTVMLWSEAGFGETDRATMLRMAIPAAVLMALGIQTASVALLRGMLGLGVRAE